MNEPAPAPDTLVAAYDFALDDDSIAQRPSAVRGADRLLVASRSGGEARHLAFGALPSLLAAGDLVILNDTRVLPARIQGRKATGGTVRLLLLQPDANGSWLALVRPSSRVRPGTAITLVRRADGAEGPSVEIGEILEDGIRRIRGLRDATVEDFGEMPLPPYIDRESGPDPIDRDRYQTVFAAVDGAVAAPTAGLHFTDELFGELAGRGVAHAHVTLHVGMGTFAPLRADHLEDIHLHSEPWRVPAATADAIARCEVRGGRIVAVGTTTCRTLESWHRAGRPSDGAWRDTSLFLHPGDPPRLDVALLTNFHLPASSLTMLVASFVGRTSLLELYEQARHRGYRFYSYGDAMLLL